VQEQAASPLRTRLLGSRPNPANPSARITFTLASTGQVRLRIYDVGGRLVRTLADERLEAAPEPYEILWDGRNDTGIPMASGVFLYQLDAPGYSSAKKLVLLK
jgi:flagellar hook assembly protein FlgD